jgi:integrase
VLRRARNEAGPKLFEHHELTAIIDAADGQLRAMILLAINTGFGNTDIASLPRSAVDLDSGWVNFPRPKTQIPRRVPLWSETVEALKSAIAERLAAADPVDEDLCFLTRQGNRWVRVQPKSDEPERIVAIDALSQRFAKLLKRVHVNGRRGLGFYTLRHVFETIGGESLDQISVDHIMGHARADMASVYRERISDERLINVTDVVHDWLFKPEMSDE